MAADLNTVGVDVMCTQRQEYIYVHILKCSYVETYCSVIVWMCWQENLVLLGTQLKAEGNCLYEAEHYSAAVELYSAAIHLGYAVLERRDTAMAQQRLSMFFSNRAACFIKMVFTAAAAAACWLYEVYFDSVEDWVWIIIGFRMSLRYKYF